MKRLLVSLDEERYEDLRRFAFEKKMPMPELVRHTIEKTFEDQLDGVAASSGGREEYMKDPSTAVPFEVAMEQLGIEPKPDPHERNDAGAGARPSEQGRSGRRDRRNVIS